MYRVLCGYVSVSETKEELEKLIADIKKSANKLHSFHRMPSRVVLRQQIMSTINCIASPGRH